MKKLNKLAVKVLSVAVAVMLLSSQSIFAWTHTNITTDTTYSGNNAYDYVTYSGNGGAFNVNTNVALSFTGQYVDFNRNNASKNNGGAIYNSGTVNIKGEAYLLGNTASSYGGAIYNTGTVEIDKKVWFGENQSKNYGKGGGAIYNKGTIKIKDEAKFTDNTANVDLSYGGAIDNESNSTFIIEKNADFTGNTAKYGGAIYNAGTIKIKGEAKFTENISDYGGAISNNDGTFIIEKKVEFTGNIAKEDGGAIKNYATFTIQDGATFKDNTANVDSGYGGAIYNENGTINLIADTNNVEFTGNKANGVSNAIYNRAGTVNLWAGSASIVFNDKISTNPGEDDGGVLNINKIISGYKSNEGTGTIILNEDMSGYTGTVNFCGGTIELGEKGKWFGGIGNIYISNNSTINFANGLVENHSFNNVNISGASTRLILPVVNADLKNAKMDTINATKFEGSGKITVNKVKIIKDTEKKEVTVTFANDVLKDKVEFNGSVETLLYKYNATYDDTTGAFTFVNEGGSGGGGGGDTPVINMVTAAGAVAASVGGYATQSAVINQAFAGIDRQMAQKVQPKTVAPKATVKPSQESSLTPTDKKQPAKTNSKQNKKSANINSSNLYVSAGNQIFDDSTTIERSLWLRPFALQETIKLNGVDIDNTLYGTLAGIDLPVGQDKQLSFYLGYAGSKQEFDEVKTNQTGYLVGLTGMLVKEKWYLGLTVNGIFNKVSADSEDETNDFDMNMFTVGAKAGYNIDLSDKWILEPNITVMYGIANSDSYETTLGSIDSQSTNNILVEEQIKAKLQLKNGWQPYGLIGCAVNLSGKPTVKAEGVELELDSIDGFVEYGIGVNKEFIGSVWSCYGQVTGRSGGRNGFGGNLGIKYKF